ncbi:MFS transporter [Micromonospora sp. 15K316]|uniref:MFS transporter n=1 Tax=Micromonospora sp. 15K316 TaxID=2530376 RepID=UPI001404964B|nr:MFS transporter [Micromonospora sp. 15K316]
MTAPSPGTADPVPPSGPRASVIVVIGGDGPAPARPAWLLIGPALTALLGVYLLAVTFGPAGTAMRMDMHLPASVIPWSFVAYLLPALLTVPVGYLLGRRWPTATALPAAILLIPGSLLTTLAPGSGSLLFARALTGIAAGLAWGVTAALVAQMRAQRAWAVPVVAGAAVLALGFGAVLGALMTRGLTWRTPFLLAVPLEVVAVLATAVSGIVLLTRRPSGPPAAPLV